MGKLTAFFKPRPKDKKPVWFKTSGWYYIFLAVLAVTTSWLVLLWPEQVSALYFEMWLAVLQFLHTPVHFQMWWFLLLELAVAWFGWLFMPRLEIPSTGMAFFYTKTWEEGGDRYFRLLGGKEAVLSKKVLERRFFRWVTTDYVESSVYGNMIVFETKNREVTASLTWKRYAESLVEENRKIRAELGNKEKSLTLQEIIELEKARRGGAE